MDDGDKTILLGLVIVLASIILFTATCMYGVHQMKIKKYENFQTTITDLSDEQKCLHICGFQYPGSTYFDNYKYCVEKCDRISERQANTEVCLG